MRTIIGGAPSVSNLAIITGRLLTYGRICPDIGIRARPYVLAGQLPMQYSG